MPSYLNYFDEGEKSKMATEMVQVLDDFFSKWVLIHRHSKSSFLQVTLNFDLKWMKIISRHFNSNFAFIMGSIDHSSRCKFDVYVIPRTKEKLCTADWYIAVANLVRQWSGHTIFVDIWTVSHKQQIENSILCPIREALHQHWEVLLVDVWRWIESHDRDIDREVDPRSHDSIGFVYAFGSGFRPRSLLRPGFLAAM